MSKDTIYRQDAIDAVIDWLKDCMENKKNGEPLTDRLKHLPSAQPEPKKGKWIKHSIGHEHTPWGFDCSECGEWFVVGEEVIKKYNYCPNCGSYNGGNSHEGTDKG